MSDRILVTGKPLSDHWVSQLRDLGLDVINGSTAALQSAGLDNSGNYRELTEAELGPCLEGVSIYIYGGLEPASKDVLDTTSSLRIIAFLGTGWSDPGCVDADAAAANGITVTNTPHANALSVAEFSLGAMLSASRHMTAMAVETASGGWTPMRGTDISSKRLGIVGLGAIGSALARFAVNGLGMKVAYYGPHDKPEIEKELDVTRVLSLEELFGISDFVSVHAPASPETAGIINKSVLSAGRSRQVLINMASPEIVDPRALLAALQDGQLGSAVFDGRYVEKDLQVALTDLGLDRYVQFPRAAWLTTESYDRMANMAYASIKAYSNKSTIPNIVLDPNTLS